MKLPTVVPALMRQSSYGMFRNLLRTIGQRGVPAGILAMTSSVESGFLGYLRKTVQ